MQLLLGFENLAAFNPDFIRFDRRRGHKKVMGEFLAHLDDFDLGKSGLPGRGV